MWAFSELRLTLQIKVFVHPKLTGMATMQGVGIEILKAFWVTYVSVSSLADIKTPTLSPSPYSVETQISPTCSHYPYTDNNKDM